MLGIDKIYNMDCIEGMKLIGDGATDLCITDPPFNISRFTNFVSMKSRRGTSMDFGDWDKGADILTWIDSLPRICKVGANVVIFNCWENIGDIGRRMRINGI